MYVIVAHLFSIGLLLSVGGGWFEKIWLTQLAFVFIIIIINFK